VIEVFIVTVGVLLALGIDQIRQHFSRLGQAEEARQLLRDEIVSNVKQIEQRMRNLQNIYAGIEANPQDAPDLSVETGLGGAAFPLDTAYTIAMQTGAFAYLRPEERTLFATAYLSQKYLEDNSISYRDAFREMISFRAGKLDDVRQSEAQLQQVKRVQIWADALFASGCRAVVNYRKALGEWQGETSPYSYCSGLDPMTTDVDMLIAGRRGLTPAVAPEPAAEN